MYAELHDQGKELLLEKESGASAFVPILGLLQVTRENDVRTTYNENDDGATQINENEEKNHAKEQISVTPGRLVVYGDSNCIDDSHLQKCMYHKNKY